MGYIFENCRLIPELSGGVGGEGLEVAVEGGKITRVGSAGGAEGERIDCGGMTLLPGLFDSHAHLSYDYYNGVIRLDDFKLLINSSLSAKRYLAMGFTTIRDMGAPKRLSVRVREAVERGLFVGPRIVSGGMILRPTASDRPADPKYVAADLLSQAEHDRLASAVLLTDSWELAQAVDREVVRQTGYLERSEIMEESLRDFGCAIVCDSLERCVELANEIAPEHLEIMTEEPRALLPLVKNAGAVFLGAYTPEPLGDYLAGPDHVLPTSGTARFFSPLSVDSFLKTMSVLEFDRAALAPIAGEIITLAETEHLTAHANSIRVRMDG